MDWVPGSGRRLSDPFGLWMLNEGRGHKPRSDDVTNAHCYRQICHGHSTASIMQCGFSRALFYSLMDKR